MIHVEDQFAFVSPSPSPLPPVQSTLLEEKDVMVVAVDVLATCSFIPPAVLPLPKTMRALVKAGARPGLEIAEVPVPLYGPEDVLIAVETASLCGTDLHIFRWDSWAQNRIKPPYVPGHEFSGTVAAVGSRVSNVRIGDFVSAEMHIACGECVQCRTQQAHVCASVQILGVDGPGAFADFVRIPASNVWKIDLAGIPREWGSLLDPFGNAVNAVLSGPVAMRTVLVTGCGPIGLFSVAVAKACGASRVLAIEPIEGRRALALRMGADAVLDPADPAAIEAAIQQLTGGVGVDVLVEMSGNAAAIRQGFKLLRNGGRASLLGLPSGPVELDLASTIIFKGANVHGINGRLMYQTWIEAEALLRHGRVDLAPVITHRFRLEEFDQAMRLLSDGEAGKIILQIR